MKKYRILAAVAAAAIAVGCTPHHAPERAWVYGTFPVEAGDTLKMTYFRNSQNFPNYTFNSESRDCQQEAVSTDGRVCIELDLSKGRLFTVIAPSMNKGIGFASTLFLHDGDSVEMTLESRPMSPAISKFTLRMSGRGSADGNFLSEVTDYARKPKAPTVANGDLAAYKSAMQSFSRTQTEHADSLFAAGAISSECLEYYRNLILIEEYANLCSAVGSNPDSAVPEGYFDGYEPDASAERYPCYTSWLNNRYISHNPEVEASAGNFDALAAEIARAPRKLRDRLTAMLIGYYARMQNPSYRDSLLAEIGRAERSISNPDYLKFIESAKRYYSVTGVIIPDDVLDGTFMRPLGSDERITLREMLARHEGRPVYIDFWASWCVGCIWDIKDSQRSRDYLKERGVDYICLSIDSDFDAWTDSARKNGVEENSYCLYDEKNSPLCRFFDIVTIPRYAIVDADCRVVMGDAARPSPYFFNTLRKQIETNLPQNDR